MYWIKSHLPKKQGTLSHCQQIKKKKNHFSPLFFPYSWVELHKIAKAQIQSLCFKILLTFFIFLISGSNTLAGILWRQSVRCMTGEVSLFVLSWHLCSVAVCWLEHVMSTGIWLNLQSSSKSFKGHLLDIVIYLNNFLLLYG